MMQLLYKLIPVIASSLFLGQLSAMQCRVNDNGHIADIKVNMETVSSSNDEIDGEKDSNPIFEKEQAMYNVGSVSKIFTATAIMQLVDAGKVDLDVPITTYLPDFRMADSRYKEITVRMLLNHTSGLMGAHLGNAILFDEADLGKQYDLLVQLQEQRLKSDPGSYASYSNDGISLAEMIVERVSNMSFSDYMKAKVFDPLGMSNSSTPELNWSDLKAKPAGCYINGNYTMPLAKCACIGSGGIMSTTEDLCKFSTLFMKNEPETVLSKSSALQMMNDEYSTTTFLNLNGSQLERFGLGFDTVNIYPFDQYGVQIVKKAGSVNFHQSNLSIAPDYDCSVAVMSAGGHGDFDLLVCNAIMAEILKDKGAIPQDFPGKLPEQTGNYTSIPSEILNYAGFYSGAKWYEISFPSDSEMLVVTCDEDSKQMAKFLYSSDGYFVNEDGYYFFDQKLTRVSGGQVKAKAYFVKEDDGNVYLCSNCIQDVEGMTSVADVENSLKKQTNNQINEDIMSTWSNRVGKGYYQIYETYSSSAWSTTSYGTNVYEELKLSQAVNGYISGKMHAPICRIIDKNRAEFAGLTSNEEDINFITENGVEYLTIGCSDYKMIAEDQIRTYQGEKLTVNAKIENTVLWYKISDQAAGQQKQLKVTGKGAIYVYNKYHNFVYSTIMQNGGNTVVLPKDGLMALVGEDGAEFVVE